MSRPQTIANVDARPLTRTGIEPLWNEGPDLDEWRTIHAFAGGPVRAQPKGDWIPRHGHELVFVSPSLAQLTTAISRSLQHAQAGAEVLLRTPASTSEPFALALFEAHTAMCFWQGPGPATLYTYCGARPWDFSRAFRARGAVLVRGRGTTGPWSP
jgi:hypothetical protein